MLVRSVVATLLGVSLVAFSVAQETEPATPDILVVTLRYRIDGVGNDRLMQYFEMVNYLKAAGFVRSAPDGVAETEPEDPKATRMQGTIPTDKLDLLFGDRRVKGLRITTRGAKIPDDKEKLVRVSLRLAGGLALDRQLILAEQTRQVLNEIGFREGVAYDHRGFTRLLGAIPVSQLDILLEDLRKTPGGTKQPAPFQNISPVLVTEVQPNLPLPATRQRPAAPPQGQERLSPELRELLADQSQAATSRRMEILLAVTPDPRDRDWIGALAGVEVEGRLGQLVTVLGRLSEAPNLAALPNVVGVRLPRAARSQVLSVENESSAEPLSASGVGRLHAMGHRGKGTRLAVIDADFRGWETHRGKGLPASTKLIDLTAERNRNLEPDPYTAGRTGDASGTRCALAAAQIAPEADITLIRIDPSAPYQLQTIAEAISGDPSRSINMEKRLAELEQQRKNLEARRASLLEERRAALEDFSPPGEETQLRKDYVRKQAAFDREERDLFARARRYQQLRRGLLDLKGIRIVTCALVWPEGYPVDGSGALSRYFDDRPFRAALWFQCAGDTNRQAWTGLFRDVDGNGVMEFAPRESELPAGSWTSELNFLAWRPKEGGRRAMLPRGARIRLSLQWREPHDPAVWRSGEDGYREPIADLRLIVLRQIDPRETERPADDMELVAESVGAPLRLESRPNSATYEQVVEVRLDRLSRLAVRIEGRLPESDQPRGSATLPGQHRSIEVRPRLYVQTLEGDGRAVFRSFATLAASIGMPGDAHAVTTIGAADGEGNRQFYSADGPAMNLDLLRKPDALVQDQLGGNQGGTGLAAARAAGLAAAMRSGGYSTAGVEKAVKANAGGLFRVPEYGPRR